MPQSPTQKTRRRRSGAPFLLILVGLPLTAPGCLLDFSQFQAPDGSGAMAGASPDSGGTPSGGGNSPGSGSSANGGEGLPSGGTTPGAGGASGGAGGGSSSGGRNPEVGGAGGTASGGEGGDRPGGAPSTGGVPECGQDTKLCAADCAPLDDPETGCASESCLACPALPGADSICAQGECALGTCRPGFFNCDGDAPSGCEHSQSTFNEFACGGCDADCTSLGLSNCQSGLCGCATAAECKGNANNGFDCQSRRCTCGGDTCNAGETCGRDGGSARCRCDRDTACAAGWTCCPTLNGAACKQLDGSDASNCGACGITCATGRACVAGVCQ